MVSIETLSRRDRSNATTFPSSRSRPRIRSRRSTGNRSATLIIIPYLAQRNAFVYRYLPLYSVLCNSEQFVAQICGLPFSGQNTPPSDTTARRVSQTLDQGSRSGASRHLSSSRSGRTVSTGQGEFTRLHKKADTQKRVSLPYSDRPLRLIFHQELGYLNRIQCSPFQELVAANPKRQAIIQRSVNAYPPDRACVLASRV